MLYRSIILVRGSLVDIIYRKSLIIELSVAQKAAPAGLVTADVERIDFTIEKLHAIWASVVELAIGIYLLKQEVGWACVAPALVALGQYTRHAWIVRAKRQSHTGYFSLTHSFIVCTIATTYISKLLPNRQKEWNQQVQKRVALTSSMLSNMKTAKMMGLSQHIATTLQKARMTELDASASFRRCMAMVNTIGVCPIPYCKVHISVNLLIIGIKSWFQGNYQLPLHSRYSFSWCIMAR